MIEDPQLSIEEARVAASLSAEFTAEVDAKLLMHARGHGRKVAMIVGLAMGNPAVCVAGLPDLYYAGRIRALVDRGISLADGNVQSMGFCEVRLA